MKLFPEILETIFTFNDHIDNNDAYSRGYMVNKYFTKLFLKSKYKSFENDCKPDKYPSLQLVNPYYEYWLWVEHLEFEIKEKQLEMLYSFNFKKYRNCKSLTLTILCEFDIQLIKELKKEYLESLKEITFYATSNINYKQDLLFFNEWDVELDLWLDDIHFPFIIDFVMPTVKELSNFNETMQQSDLNTLSTCFPNVEQVHFFLDQTFIDLNLSCFTNASSFEIKGLNTDIIVPDTANTLLIELADRQGSHVIELPSELESFCYLSFEPLHSSSMSTILTYMRDNCAEYTLYWGVNEDVVFEIFSSVTNELDDDDFIGIEVGTEYIAVQKRYMHQFDINPVHLAFLGKDIQDFLISKLNLIN